MLKLNGNLLQWIIKCYVNFSYRNKDCLPVHICTRIHFSQSHVSSSVGLNTEMYTLSHFRRPTPLSIILAMVSIILKPMFYPPLSNLLKQSFRLYCKIKFACRIQLGQERLND